MPIPQSARRFPRPGAPVLALVLSGRAGPSPAAAAGPPPGQVVCVKFRKVAYVKVGASNRWAGACGNCQIGTFRTFAVSPQLTHLETAALAASGNRGAPVQKFSRLKTALS